MSDKPKFFEHGGRVFVSITDTRARAIDSITSHTCVLVADWDAAIKTLQEFLAQNRFCADEVDMFTKPRLCEKCMRHAVQPEVFDDAKHVEECLCWMEGTPCGVHKNREK